MRRFRQRIPHLPGGTVREKTDRIDPFAGRPRRNQHTHGITSDNRFSAARPRSYAFDSERLTSSMICSREYAGCQPVSE